MRSLKAPWSAFLALVLSCGPALAQSDLFSFSVKSSAELSKRVEVTAFAPDGSAIAAGLADGQVGVMATADGTWRPLTRHSGAVTSLAFSRDGKLLVSAGADGVIRATPMGEGQPVEMKRRGRVDSAAISPGREFIAAADDKSVTLFDAASGRELYALAQNKKALRALGFARNGDRLIGVSEQGAIFEWDVKTRTALRQMQDSDKTAFAGATNNGGNLLAISTEFADFQKGAFGNVGAMARPTDMYREERVKIYDMETGTIAKVLDGINGQARALAFSADARFLALVRQAMKDSFLVVYDVQRGTQVTSIPLQGSGSAVSFSGDGRWLSSATDRGNVTLYAVSGVMPGAAPTDLAGQRFTFPVATNAPLIDTSARVILAVMDFQTDGVDASSGHAASVMVQARLEGARNVQMVERNRLDQLLKEQNFSMSDRVDPATAVRFGRLLGAQKLLAGSVSKTGTKIIVTVEAYDVETGAKNLRQVECNRCTIDDLSDAIGYLKPKLVKE